MSCRQSPSTSFACKASKNSKVLHESLLSFLQLLHFAGSISDSSIPFSIRSRPGNGRRVPVGVRQQKRVKL